MSENKINRIKCKTPEFRVSFPNVFKPKAFKAGDEAKYSVTMLFPKNVDISALKVAAHNAAVDKWGEDKKKWPKTMRTPFRDGDAESGQDGYAGQIFIRASAKEDKQPQIVHGPDLDRLTNEKDFYAGCYARATLIAFAYDSPMNKGISFALQNLHKTREGKPFSGRKNAADEFNDGFVVTDDGSDDPSNYAEHPSDASADDNMGF